MKDELFKELLGGIEEMTAYHRGEHPNPENVVIHTPKPVDVAALRNRLGLSQAGFARAFGVSVGTIQNWEQARRTPEGPARTLLRVIEREPEAVMRALHLVHREQEGTEETDAPKREVA